MTTVIRGRAGSIRIEGELNGVITPELDEDSILLLACSEGTLLRASQDSDCIWRFTRIAAGGARFVKEEGNALAGTSDKVTLFGSLKWIVLGYPNYFRAGISSGARNSNV